MRRKTPRALLCGAALVGGLPAPGIAQTGTSGGVLLPEQAAYDVRFYDLELMVEPSDSSIAGALEATVTVRTPLREVVLHLDDRLTVDRTAVGHAAASVPFRHEDGLVRVRLDRVYDSGEDVRVRVEYGGRPLVSESPQSSWGDGFAWRRTTGGEPWIGVVSVLQGADLWWPTKDHPSDEPDSMAIHIRVRDPLTVVANGQSRGVEGHSDGTSTHHWFVSTPINNYGVSITIGPFEVLETTFESVGGERFPFQFWVLPERLDEGRRLFEDMQRDMRFFEALLGPYPFRRDKYAVVHTPYVAMEHQTVIAYGSNFEDNPFGFDFYHFHELAHEWWANKLTAADWRDWWLHEGFATYMEALYAEELGGLDAYHEYVAAWGPRIANASPVVPAANSTTHDAYTGDIYRKGAAILHMVRYRIGRDALVEVFRRMHDRPADPGGEACGCRAVDTDEFRRTIVDVTGRDLSRLFDVYLRGTAVPRLEVDRSRGELILRWVAADGEPFELPLEVRVGSSVHVVEMSGGRGRMAMTDDAEVQIDPAGWILMTIEENR